MDLPDIQLHRLNTTADIPTFEAWLHRTLDAHQPVAIDCETMSVDKPFPWPVDYGKLWQIGTADEAWAIDMMDWRHLIRDTINKVVASGVRVWGANFAHDQRTMYWAGLPTIPWSQVHDVIIADRLVNYFHWSHALKVAAVRELGDWADIGQEILEAEMAKHKYTWDTVPTTFEPYWTYGALDTAITVRLGEKLLPRLPEWYDVEIMYHGYAFEWECRGLRIDEAAVHQAEQHWSQEAVKRRQALHDLGFEAENLASQPQVRSAFEAMGITSSQVSKKTGLPLWNKDVLRDLADSTGLGGQVARALAEYRHYAAWANNYGTKLLNFLDSDGRLVFKMNPMEAFTGRSSITDPALQTIPKHAMARSMFIAGPGRKLVAVDYESQELRVLAGLSGDPALTQFFSEGGGDIHQFVADMANVPRDAAKTLNYARAYGASNITMAARAGISFEDMNEVVDRVNAAFPRANQWLVESRAKAEREGRVELPYGRFLKIKPDRSYTTGPNYNIQGHGADVLKLAVVRLYAEGLGPFIRITMHDEALFSFPAKDARYLGKRAAEIMIDNRLPVQLTTDASDPYDSWGQKYQETT